jgi:protein-tyrosine phosphatase
MNELQIIIVGAADTGRAPMAVALLARLLAHAGHSLILSSAGIVGHDEDPAEPEARAAMRALGLDIEAHRARSLSTELVAQARLLLAVESGVARVVRTRFPKAEIYTLGELAGRSRDIPDPFRMQMGAWVQYANEIESLLRAGLPHLLALLGVPAAPPTSTLPVPPHAIKPGPLPTPSLPPLAAGERAEAIAQALRLIDLTTELPEVVSWTAAREHIEADLATIEAPLPPADLARPYLATLRVMLHLSADTLNAGQASALRAAFRRLGGRIGPPELEALSRDLAHFQR